MITIFSGPPANKADDYKTCRLFCNSKGLKIICGTTTIKIYCRETNTTPEITIRQILSAPVVRYAIPGIYLATEGAITLNECYNILNFKKSSNEEACKLADIMIDNKDINFIIGSADNKDKAAYMQQGIIERIKIIELIASKLQNKNITMTKA